MTAQLMWVVIVIAAAVAMVLAFLIFRRRRTEHLRRRFGSEYERTVREKGAIATAEATLQAREARVAKLHIRPLSSDETARYSREWRDVQTMFVDNPRQAIADADRLVGELMRARGYPVGDFDQRVADISVDHPNVVMNYRAAHDIAQDHARGRASTEDLRQAFVHYRALFADLLGTSPVEPTPPERLVTPERGRA